MQTVIVIGASAGGIAALSGILSTLPADFSAAILVVIHIGARNSLLPELLAKSSNLPVRFAQDLEPILPGIILVAPPDCHMLVALIHGQATVKLTRGPKENHTRPAIDPLFRSAAAALGSQVVGVVLSGYLNDGTAGLQAIQACGGVTFIQDPKDAVIPSMPENAIHKLEVDWCLPAAEIGMVLQALISGERLPPKSAATGERLARAGAENRFVRGNGSMEDLQKFATPSTLVCPECQGALWEVYARHPQRFRCKARHSFTAEILGGLQYENAENAIWAAVRALQEREELYSRLAAKATIWQHSGTAIEYERRASQACELANMLRRALVAER